MRSIVPVCCVVALLFFTPAVFAEEGQSGTSQADRTTVVAEETPPEESAEGTPEQPATEEKSSEEAETLEPVVVTATKIETPISQIGASVSVITEQQIEERNTNEVITVLRNVPGVNIIQDGPKGSTAHVFMRGGESDYTLVMIDGVKLNDDGGLVDLSHLDTDNIERIEVVRGPQSALYGADAMTGVINIITKKGEGPPHVTASSEVGTDDTFRERFSISGSKGIVNYSAAADYFDTSNRPETTNDRYENLWLSSRIGLDLSAIDADLALITTFQKSEFGNAGPTEMLPEDKDDKVDNRQGTVALNFDQHIKDWWEHVFQISFFDQKYENTDSSFSNIVDFITDYRADLDRLEANYQHNFTILNNYVLSVGGDWMQEEGDISSMSDFGFGPSVTTIDKIRTNRALFAQVAASYWDRLNIVAGARYDDNSSFGTEVSPRVTASYLVKETNTRIKGSYGEGIKNPSFFDLFAPFFGNPDLEAEKSKSWDAGIEQKFTLLNTDATVGVTYFDQHFDNLIQFVGTSVENFGEAVARGIESEVTLALPYDFTLAAAYTYLIKAVTTSEPTPDMDLLRRPKHLASVNLNYKHDRWNVNLNVNYVGERADVNPVTFALGEEADDFTKVDLAASYDLNPHVQLIGIIENILDQNTAQSLGFQSTGISFLAGVRGIF